MIWVNGMTISASEFASKWDGDDIFPFVRIPIDMLMSYGVDGESLKFHEKVGLPAWAAPNINFFYEGGTLPLPSDDRGNRVIGVSGKLGQFGSTGEGWPICMEMGGNGKIICINLNNKNELILLNSSLIKLCETLFAFNCIVAAAIDFGELNGHKDAWRKGLYPAEFDIKLQEEIKKIDCASTRNQGYWSMYFSNVFKERKQSERLIIL
jgi:hypothetical protein